MFQRPLFQVVRKRIIEPRRFIQVVSGPRQVGKTTLVNQVLFSLPFPGHYSSADGFITVGTNWIQEQWEVARVKQRQHPSADFLLILDEIQKIENWSEAVKKEWDADSLQQLPIKVILSGSSRLLIQEGLSESLTGRFELISMGHWSYAEMKAAFGLTPAQYVWFGGYPGSAGIIDQEERWKQYISDSIIETTISKDILMLTRIEKPALLRRLFEFGCAYSGQILSFTKMLGQLAGSGNTTTLSHYLDLLNQAGLLTGLEKYSANQIRQRSSSPKLLIYNTALISSQHQESFSSILQRPDLWGRLVESAVGAHLLNHSLSEGFSIHYWLDHHNEVDYVIRKKGIVIGLEVSSGESHKRSGMKAFQEKYHPSRVLMVGKSGIPWEEFLLINPRELF
ncbi:MAG: ATP-binding protein [Bacteroidales bacterium]|nr:ATP-binding protein [Bacteroidales bacterium]